jgi:hypothetical protein
METRDKDYIHRRAALLARLFLEDLGASVWATVPGENQDLFDCIATFELDNQKSRVTAVQVKATEQPVDNEFRFLGDPKSIRSLQHSNVPVLFLVVDVKRNQVFYGWAKDLQYNTPHLEGKKAIRCLLRVVPAAERKEGLLQAIRSQPETCEPAAVGS